MFYIRVVNTASGARAVQIIYYRDRKRIVFKHIGSGYCDEDVAALKLAAQDIIDNYAPTLPFVEDFKFNNLLLLDKSELTGIYYGFFHELFSKILTQIGLDGIKQPMLLDLVVMRLFEPASKLRSIELLEECFGVKYNRQRYYDAAPRWLDLKDNVVNIATSFARRHYSFSYDLLFYDVTTLYFETFKEDELRKNGFSKDNKSQQPQILIALMVTKEGLPIAYEIFAGNTFEGHTVVPVIKEFIRKNNVQNFTVVADAAMISEENIKQLTEQKINYIVGARLGNISKNLFAEIDAKMLREDGKTIRIETKLGYLICSFSSLRYRKDKHEMDRQIERAKQAVDNPSRSKKLKFTQTSGTQVTLNEALITKTKKLLGIKGYYTNLEAGVASDSLVIERYHELYKIEQAFRISKHDLQARPIFHFKEEPIKLHILICFMALLASKHTELKTNTSINKFTRQCKKVTDARIYNQLTKRESRLRAKIPVEFIPIIQLLNLPH